MLRDAVRLMTMSKAGSNPSKVFPQCLLSPGSCMSETMVRSGPISSAEMHTFALSYAPGMLLMEIAGWTLDT